MKSLMHHQLELQLKSKINTMSSSSADLTSFVDTFKTKLQAEGYQTTDIEVPPSSVTTAELVVLTPAPTRSPTMAPSALPTEATPAPPKAYVPSDVVTKLNGFPHDVTTFDPANTDYLMGIVKISAGPIIVFIICYLFYWSFLCGRNCSHCCPVTAASSARDLTTGLSWASSPTRTNVCAPLTMGRMPSGSTA